jgi:hypothetical protein
MITVGLDDLRSLSVGYDIPRGYVNFGLWFGYIFIG